MKDPAFLFYSSDFLSGISDLTMEERGQYITMLCLQHQKGNLSEKTIRLNVGSVSVDVIAKFKKDNEGNFYNERLVSEIEKRNLFTESRRNNGIKGGRPKKETKPKGKPKENHMDNHMGNVNEDVNKDIKGNVNDQIKEIFCNFYLEKTTTEYIWTEKDWGKTKTLRNKLLIKIKEKNPDLTTEKETETIIEGFNHLLKGIKDTWILSNLSMSIIDTKFNEIINQIINPTNGKQSVTDKGKSELAKVLAGIAAE